MYPKQRKIAIMGYRAVGKTSLSIQFVDGQFVEAYDPTIENTFLKNTVVNEQEYELKLVDTAGQDEYSIIPTPYLLDIHGYVLVYSITAPKSFEVVQILYDKMFDMGRVNIPVVLVGNKTDLHEHRMVTEKEGQDLADKWKAVFLEVSAKKNDRASIDCVSNIFHTLLMEIEKANGDVQTNSTCSLS